MRGMKEKSFLEQGMRQSILVGRRVAEVNGGLGLVDVRRVWERGEVDKELEEKANETISSAVAGHRI